MSAKAGMPEIDGFIFDMDGTLLHTLPDLAAVTNKALELEGFPPHTEEQIRTFVGNGALALARLAVPDGATEEQVEKVFRNFKSLYGEFGLSLTSEFEGMTETLKELHARGKKLGIMSNKFEGGVKDVEAKFFPGCLMFPTVKPTLSRASPIPMGSCCAQGKWASSPLAVRTSAIRTPIL
jgi:phosphoglycolate phosphatase